MARKRTPPRGRGGRFAKRGRARRNPPTKYRSKRRSTRAGGRRVTARKAYAPKRRARRNQPMLTPAVRYSLLSGAGAVSGFWLDGYKVPGLTAIAGSIPMKAVTNSTVVGALAIALGMFTLRGNARKNTMAFGVGSLVPTVGRIVTNGDAGLWSKRTVDYGTGLRALYGNSNGNASGNANANAAALTGGALGYRAPQLAYSNPFLSTSRGLNVA